jgi:hypothetical protein
MSTKPISIPLEDHTSRIVAASISPTTTSIHDRLGGIRQPKVLHPIDNDDLKLLILENISQEAVKAFQAEGYRVDHHTTAMSEDELVQKIGSYHAIGIRSKTKITERVIKAATKACLFTVSGFIISYTVRSVTRHWLLLHRHQPSRPPDGSQSWHPSVQLSLLQLPFCGRTCHG